MIGDKIKILRKEKHFTQKDLAKMLSVSPSLVAMWETNKRDIDTEQLAKIIATFDVSPDYLLNAEESMLSIKIPKHENSVTIMGKNGIHKTYIISDSDVKTMLGLAERLDRNE